jgi:hypothetical protein
VSRDREYELGVADVMAYLVGPGGTAQHDQRPTGAAGRKRQVDIVLRGVSGLPDEAIVIVDCKLHRRRVNVGYVDSFAGLVDDVGATMGLLVSASGFSELARERARRISMRVHTLTRDELAQWVPAGTRFVRFAIPIDRRTDAWGALIKAGYRADDLGFAPVDEKPGEVQLETYRLADVSDPSEFQDGAVNALRAAGIEARVVATGVVMGGGTPAHTWVWLHFDGWASPIGVNVATEEELQAEIVNIGRRLGLPVSAIDARRPEGWPRPPLLVADLVGGKSVAKRGGCPDPDRKRP